MLKGAKRVGLACAIAISACFAHTPAAFAAGNDYRWFEVEVLVFRHLSTPDADEEVFPNSVTPIPTRTALDLISSQLNPHKLRGIIAALPLCSWVRDLPNGVGEYQLNSMKKEFSPLPGVSGAPITSTDIFCRYQEHAIVTDNLYAPTPADPGMDAWDKTPTVISGEGGDMQAETGPFLLEQNALTFNTLKNQLERRGLARTLLHTSWRQPVFNRNGSQFLRLFGGHNFTREFDYFGFSKEDSDEFYDREQKAPLLFTNQNPNQQQLNQLEELLSAIDQGLFRFVRPAQGEQFLAKPPSNPPYGLPKDIWEFDGLLRVYLVGNYLHIDTEFNLREPENVSQQLSSVEEQAKAWLQGEVEAVPFLRAYHLKQLRRVISHERHYFDHPKFGVIVEIRRTDLSQRR